MKNSTKTVGNTLLKKHAVWTPLKHLDMSQGVEMKMSRGVTTMF